MFCLKCGAIIQPGATTCPNCHAPVEQKKNDTILITCNLKDDTVTLFDYYKELSFEDFNLMGKSLKQCDDINDVYIFLKNVFSESKITTSRESLSSKVELQILDNEKIVLLLKIPLFTEKYEEIKIEFSKKNKDFSNQYIKIREKYQSLKKMVYEENRNYNPLIKVHMTFQKN